MAAQVKEKERKAVTSGKTTIIVEPGKQEVITIRVFDVPPQRLFKAMTDPKLIPQWWGPAQLKTVVDKMDARPGGTWRYVQHDPAGAEYSFHGVYHQVDSPERLVHTFEFEGVPGHVALETCTFEDLGGQTRLIDQIVFQSVDDRDGMVQTGMESGQNEAMDRLAVLVATM